MYGTHHKTGKKIRLLQHDTSTWKSKKTLVWLKSTDDLTHPWDRFDVGVAGSQEYIKCVEKGLNPDIVVCINIEDKAWIEEGQAKVRLIFASKEVLDIFGPSFL